MSGAIHLRPGQVADLGEAMIVMEEAFDPVFGEAWTHAQCAGLMALPGVWLTLASDAAGTPAGFSLARVILDEAELLLIGVRPGWRRRGVGRALLEATEAGAGARGAGVLHLEVRAGNPAAALYAAAGFLPAGRRTGYYAGRDGQLFDAVTLNKTLCAI